LLPDKHSSKKRFTNSEQNNEKGFGPFLLIQFRLPVLKGIFTDHQKLMKILLLIRNFDFGGAENHVCDLANELHDLGHQIVVVSGKGRQQDRLNSNIIHYAGTFSNLKVFFQTIRIIRIIHRHQIDIIHAHQRLPLLSGAIAARITGKPVVGTIHSMLKQDVKLKWLRKNLTKIIVVSENSFKGTQNDPLLKSKSIFIPNGIVLTETPLAKSPSSLKFCYVSRMNNRHTGLIGMLLEQIWPTVIEKYPEAVLTIVGNGIGMTELLKIVQDEKYKCWVHSVRFSGYVENIASEIKNASLVFGVGRVAQESLALGVPVLSVKSNRMGPLITQSNFERLQYGNFVDIEAREPDIHSFMLKIDDFVAHQEFYKNETIELSKRIANSRNIKEIIASTVQIYSDLLQDKTQINH